MKKHVIILILCCFLFGTTAWAQKKATISFAKTEYNFGLMKELEGKKTCTFEFTNAGTDSLKILDVKLSCGCTAADWTKTPVLPKKKGFVNITYDPVNRPGQFSKGIEVKTNDPDQPSVTLVITGIVEARPRTIADDYPFQIGHLRFDKQQLVFQNLPNTEIHTDTIKIYNEWNQQMTFDMSQMPVHIKCIAVPEKLKAEKKGYFLISYNASMRNDFGFVNDRFVLITNDSLEPQKQISISANIVEDFSKYTPEQLANAPKISFETPTYDFGSVQEGVTVTWDYVFTNLGKDDLIIRKVKGG